ncbi:TauD/TfdA family dioxygenase [Plastoroseomonas arctica]|uniref:TauD/TfdA family dioxygenase n=1 Tax=Plastoroseomonas arctica TaxID=1509237 RepID=A0AAF1KKY0_9PROT|nr:TauD/TfdA family dioxygenase [Plastoroseomonas arctica]MBR0657120.1 TauD/TfdA family dioxygenase [Plastoroseomonas arctica]
MNDIIGGRAAWRGDQVTQSPLWGRRFTEAEIAALDAALAGTRGIAPPRLRAEDFAIPTLRPLLDAVAEELEQGTGVVRLSGLPTGRWDAAALKTVFWGICANLGTPLYQTAAGEVLAEVKDETGTGAAVTGATADGSVPSARARSRSTGPLRFHTDKCDILALLCASNGIAGGVSKVVSTVAVQDEISRRDPALLKVLYEDFWRMKPGDEEGERTTDRIFAMPVFARGPAGEFTSQYSRTYVEMAHAVEGVPALKPEQIAAMDLLAEVAEELCYQAPFDPGDLQLLNQHVSYHGRTAYSDGAEGKRVLLRIWLAVPFSRALPEGHRVQWGETRPGALRGGAILGRSAIAA